MIEKGFVVNGLILRFREIKAQHLFEQETSQLNFPQYQDGSFMSNFKLGLFDYLSLLRTRSMSQKIDLKKGLSKCES